MNRKPLARPASAATLLLAVIALLLSGCGFQPRGQALSVGTVPSPIHVSGIGPYTELRRELDRQLTVAGAELSDTMAGSAAILTIENWDSESRVLSVNSRNRVVEYELEESVRFSLRSTEGQELAAPQTVRVLRISYQPEVEVLGSTREAALLRRDMRRDLSQLIIRRIAVQR